MISGYELSRFGTDVPVTGVTVKDCRLLARRKVFKTEQMNQAVFAFRRYQDGSDAKELTFRASWLPRQGSQRDPSSTKGDLGFGNHVQRSALGKSLSQQSS